MAKRPRRKASLHSAGKVTEQELLERARELADDPSLALPVCEGGCALFSPVKAARRAVMKVHRDRDDEGKLQKHAQRGNDYARAYAATLLVARSEKIPYVADLKMGGQVVPYVMRGKTKPFYLAGLQHHDDRALRLLAVAPWVKKRGLNFFSAERGIVCTGKTPRPPQDFVAEEAELLDLTRQGEAYVCEHGGASSRKDTIVIDWPAAKTRFERCAACAHGGSTMGELRRHMAGPRLSAMFDVRVELAPLDVQAGAPPDVTFDLPAEVRTQYLKGTITDEGLVAAARAARTEALRRIGRRLYVAGDAAYGADLDAFVAALSPSPAEERALRAVLEGREAPVVLDRASSARALAELWPEEGSRMLEAVSDQDTASKLHRADVGPEEAADLVRRAAKEGSARAALADLPAYNQLPRTAAVADAVVRAHRTSGRSAAVKEALDRSGRGEVAGAVLALLEALGGAKGQEWRFTHTDKELAESLAPLVRELLEAPPSRYHEALARLSAAAGDTATFEPRG